MEKKKNQKILQFLFHGYLNANQLNPDMNNQGGIHITIKPNR